MSIIHLMLSEAWYRKGNSLLGTLSVAIAAACAIGALLVLRRFDSQTERIIAAKETETRERMKKLEDDYRKITLGLGFNVLILPEAQDLDELFAQDYGSVTIPEEYVDRLARSRVATIQHLLPSLQRKLKWPEFERTVIVTGIRGEVPILHADLKKPLLQPVPPGTMVVGWELHRNLHLQAGQKVKLLGREFTVSKLQPERGTKDDITVWIDLKQSQELFDQPGRINGILALECVCAADSLDKVRAEIASLLPDTKVLEFQSQTLARAEARQRAAAEAKTAVEAERQNREELRQQRGTFASILVPVVMLGSALWIGFLSLGNVRERRSEIGLLRAIGVRTSTVLGLFLGRAFVIGVAGGLIGYTAGRLVPLVWREGGATASAVTVVSGPGLFLLALGLAAALSVLASWLPSLLATQQDPAEVLREE